VRIAADRLRLDAADLADLNQHSRLEVQPALVVVLDMIAVFPWRELRSQPLARVQPIARVRHLDLVSARRIGDLKDFLGQQISALFSRARVHVGKVLAGVATKTWGLATQRPSQRHAVAQGVKLGRPKTDIATARKVRKQLAKGVGILKVAKSLGIGIGTVRRISNELR